MPCEYSFAMVDTQLNDDLVVCLLVWTLIIHHRFFHLSFSADSPKLVFFLDETERKADALIAIFENVAAKGRVTDLLSATSYPKVVRHLGCEEKTASWRWLLVHVRELQVNDKSLQGGWHSLFVGSRIPAKFLARSLLHLDFGHAWPQVFDHLQQHVSAIDERLAVRTKVIGGEPTIEAGG